MASNRISIVFAGFILTAVACTDKWKETTTMTVSFNAKPLQTVQFLTVTEAYVNITGFHFSGTRKQGSDVSFSASPTDNIEVELTDSAGSSLSTYDLPQGTYQHVNAGFSLLQDNSNAALQICGKYIKFTPPFESDEYRYRITYNLPENITVQPDLPSSGIDIIEGTPYRLLIQADMNYLLGSFSEYDFRAASKKYYYDKEYIFIDTQNNYNLYEKIKTRLPASFSATLAKK